MAQQSESQSLSQLESQFLSPLSADLVAQLQQYSACDISDALLKLKVPGAGFIADLVAYSPLPGSQADSSAVTVAPVSTVLFVPKGQKGQALEDGGGSSGNLPAFNIPKDTHWADLAEPGTFVVLKQPPGQTNAVCGGIMALRMKVRQVRGIVVAGRVRDLDELRSTSLPIWGYGTSTVGAGGGSVPWATQVPVEINGVVINPGDIAFHDPVNGVVIIPRDKVDRVLELLPDMVAADARVKEDVLKGMSVHEAFKLHRGT
ncbi:Protein DlpA-like protein [Cladobotryum mycophilum]|uniref:Protein DlpA-like protein n=1 Tax=Cladobotryum mycophilum TaxID=491253 RepID=A0ABR0S6V5_9HYPO